MCVDIYIAGDDVCVKLVSWVSGTSVISCGDMKRFVQGGAPRHEPERDEREDERSDFCRKKKLERN